MGLKSKVGLVAAKALALRINLNIQGHSISHLIWRSAIMAIR
jgi:hypothetical protein